MKIGFVVRRFFRNLLCFEILNLPVRQLLKLNYLASAIPDKYLEIVPVSGIVNFNLPNSKRVALKTDGNDIVVRALYWQGLEKFEGGTIPLFIKLLKSTHTFLDVGANTGLYSLIAATDNSERKVYAFEPLPSILPYLKTNIELNQVENLEICPSAVTNYDGEIKLYVPSDAIPTSASTAEGFRAAERVISVPAVTIDSFTQMNNIPQVDLIKIDTETTEHMVLQGAKHILEKHQPIVICEVLQGGKTEKYLHEILEHFNYKYFSISNQSLIEKDQLAGDNAFEALNYLFIPQNKISAVMSQLS